ERVAAERPSLQSTDEHPRHCAAALFQALDHALQIFLHRRVEVFADPGMALELDRMRRLVECEPHPELVVGQAELALRVLNIRLDEVELAGLAGPRPEQADVVLAEHAASEVAEQHAD